MRDEGKRISELKQSLPHTKPEMLANAPRKAVKTGGAAFSQSVKNSTIAKQNHWSVMPESEKDISLKKTLKSYFGLPNVCQH